MTAGLAATRQDVYFSLEVATSCPGSSAAGPRTVKCGNLPALVPHWLKGLLSQEEGALPQ